MGLWMLRYLVGFGAAALIARALGPTGRGLYAYPVALLGLMVAIGHIGLEFAQIYLAGQGRELRRMWAIATVISLVTGAICCIALGAAILITPRVAGGLPLSWLAISAGLVPVTLMSLYWGGLLQIDDKLMATGWAAWFGAALQAAAVGTLYALHELTPFRVLRLRPCPEYELVAAEPASRCLEVTQLKTQPVHKCEDFPRFGHFEWIASNPIDHVMPTRHAPWAGRHVAASSPDCPVQRFQWLMTA
jgi:hypothetical protein